MHLDEIPWYVYAIVLVLLAGWVTFMLVSWPVQ